MKSLVSVVRTMCSGIPPGALWLIASAILALTGARGFAHMGAHALSQLGVAGAAGALAAALAFCNWGRPNRSRR